MKKFELPKWVYDTLEKRKNVALPDMCNELNRDSLRRHLANKVGFRVKMRKAIYVYEYCLSNGKRIKVEKPYLIAERKKEVANNG